MKEQKREKKEKKEKKKSRSKSPKRAESSKVPKEKKLDELVEEADKEVVPKKKTSDESLEEAESPEVPKEKKLDELVEEADKEMEELEKKLQAAKLKAAKLKEAKEATSKATSKEAKKKTNPNPKFYFTSLDNRKDGKLKDNQIKLKATGQTHVYVKHEDEGGAQANSPFYFRKVTGDFKATVKVTSRMNYWLDQAGLLIRAKKMGLYTKVGLEYHDDPNAEGNFNYYAAAYVHRKNQLKLHNNPTPYPGQWKSKDLKYDYVKLEKDPKEKVDIWFKVSRLDNFIETEYSLDSKEWIPLRQSKFTKEKTLSVGVFAASGLGESEGVKVTFEDLSIEEDSDWEDDGDEDDTDDEEGSIISHDMGRKMLESAEEELRQVQAAKDEEMEDLMARMKAATSDSDLVLDFDLDKEVAEGRRSSLVDPATTLQKTLLSDSDDSDDDSDSD